MTGLATFAEQLVALNRAVLATLAPPVPDPTVPDPCRRCGGSGVVELKQGSTKCPNCRGGDPRNRWSPPPIEPHGPEEGRSQLEQYLDDCQRRNLRPRTLEAYRRCLLSLHASTPLDRAGIEDVTRWLDGRHVGPSARASYIAAVAGFYRWRHRMTGQEDPTTLIVRPKLPRRLPRPAPTAELERAIGEAPPMLRAWLCLAAYGGLRCVEIAGLRAEDVDPGPPAVLRLSRTKGNRPRVVPMNSAVQEALEAHGIPATGPVFLDRQGRAFHAYEVSRQGCAYLKARGLPGMHTFRHSFATRLYGSTRDLLLVAQVLGHADVGTTAGYAKVRPGR